MGSTEIINLVSDDKAEELLVDITSYVNMYVDAGTDTHEACDVRQLTGRVRIRPGRLPRG